MERATTREAAMENRAGATPTNSSEDPRAADDRVQILLAPEYYAFPLWPGREWSDLDTSSCRCPRTSSRSYGHGTTSTRGFSLDERISDAEAAPRFWAINARGRELLARVRSALGPRYAVGYYDIETRTTSW
jgi:hypothetical protein